MNEEDPEVEGEEESRSEVVLFKANTEEGFERDRVTLV